MGEPAVRSLSGARSRWDLRAISHASTLILLLLAGGTPVRAVDPYAAALDKRFDSEQNPKTSPDPKVAALEEALRRQVREMAQRPEPTLPPASSASEPGFVLVSVLAGALVLGLTAVLILRQWNHWLDTQAAKRLSAFAEDPLMAEFLRALHEDPLLRARDEPSPAASAVRSDPLDAAASVADKVTQSRASFQKLTRATEPSERQEILDALLTSVGLAKEAADHSRFRSVYLLASALHGLLNQLSIRTSNITPSTLRTAAAALDLLELLCSRPSRPDLATAPPVRLLAADDDAISRRAVLLALKKVFSDPDLAADGCSALSWAERQAYDVIFLDIEMPGMDGFEVCSRLRKTAGNHATPVVFVTSHSDFDSRAKSALVGAHELIGKPFLAFEITVKALTLVLKARQAREPQTALDRPQPAPLGKSAEIHPQLPTAAPPSQEKAAYPVGGAAVCPPPA